MSVTSHFNTKKLIKNLTIVALVYIMINIFILYHHELGLSNTVNIIPLYSDIYRTKYQMPYKANDSTLFIHNYDLYCSKSTHKQWTGFNILHINPDNLYIYNSLHTQCQSQQSEQTPSNPSNLNLIVITDPLHWIYSQPDSTHMQQIEQWNAYYKPWVHSKTPNIIIRHEDMLLHNDAMTKKLCHCTTPPTVSNPVTDACSVLQKVLFLVFRSSIQDDGVDGRNVILKTWANNTCELHIKFVNTRSQKYVNNSINNELFDNVIQPPFDAESGMSLLWAIHQYAQGMEWVFKLDDVTFVLMDNLVRYLTEIRRYKRMWWLGNRLQTNRNDNRSIFTSGGAGYLMNKAIINQIVDSIESADQRYDKVCSGGKWEDLCISRLLNRNYGVSAANTVDVDEFEKFNVWSPMSIFGYGGIYKLPVDWYAKYKRYAGQKEEKVGVEYISKTPITFHYVKPEWMDAYYQLFVKNKKAKDIETISKRIGKHHDREVRLRHLDEYGQMVRKYSKGERIKNIENELQSTVHLQLSANIKEDAIHDDGDRVSTNVSWIMDRYHTFSNSELLVMDSLLDQDIVNMFGYRF
eukprot:345695_1